MITWQQIYEFLHIAGLVDFISSPQLQAQLLPFKVLFIAFGFFFFAALMYFYVTSTYLKYQFLQDSAEFLSWQPYGLRVMNRRLDAIRARIQTETEEEYKAAITELDDMLYQALEEKGYQGDSFEELVKSAGGRAGRAEDLLEAHLIRNLIVYESDYVLDIEMAKRMLTDYEAAIRNIIIR